MIRRWHRALQWAYRQVFITNNDRADALQPWLNEAPTDLAERRMSERRRVDADPSDATPGIAAAMQRDADPWPEATVVDTARTRAAALAAALATIADPSATGRAPAAAGTNGPGASSPAVVP